MNKNSLPAGTLFFLGFCVLNFLLSQFVVMSGSEVLYQGFYGGYGVMENQTVILYIVCVFIAGRALLNNKKNGVFWTSFLIISSLLVLILELHIYGITEWVEMVFQGLPRKPTFMQMMIVSSGRLFFALFLFYICFFCVRYRRRVSALLEDKKQRFYPVFIGIFLCLLLIALFFDFEAGLEHVEESLEVDAAILWLIFAFSLEEDGAAADR